MGNDDYYTTSIYMGDRNEVKMRQHVSHSSCDKEIDYKLDVRLLVRGFAN